MRGVPTEPVLDRPERFLVTSPLTCPVEGGGEERERTDKFEGNGRQRKRYE
jgi:hypothetical protein